jgi:hypothetical protein
MQLTSERYDGRGYRTTLSETERGGLLLNRKGVNTNPAFSAIWVQDPGILDTIICEIYCRLHIKRGTMREERMMKEIFTGLSSQTVVRNTEALITQRNTIAGSRCRGVS